MEKEQRYRDKSPTDMSNLESQPAGINESQEKENRKFIILRSLGQGSFGKVKEALHVLTKEKLAIKILEKERIKKSEDLVRIKREMKILSNVNHPNIIQLYEVIETRRYYFFVMEYAKKGELSKYIKKNVRLCEAEACSMFQQIISGIEYLHSLGYVHRDIKPTNQLLDESLRVKIIDFGLGNIYEKKEVLKTPCGSPCYAAPEVIAGNVYEPLKVDIWSAGITLFAMVCGYLPFDEEDKATLYNKILHCDYQIPNFLSNVLKDLLRKILVRNPNTRWGFAEIKKHKWFNIVENSAIKKQRPFVNDSENDSGESIQKFNKYVLRYAAIYCNIHSSVQEKMLKDYDHNKYTTTYFLLMKKFERGELNEELSKINLKEKKQHSVNNNDNLNGSKAEEKQQENLNNDDKKDTIKDESNNNRGENETADGQDRLIQRERITERERWVSADNKIKYKEKIIERETVESHEPAKKSNNVFGDSAEEGQKTNGNYTDKSDNTDRVININALNINLNAGGSNKTDRILSSNKNENRALISNHGTRSNERKSGTSGNGFGGKKSPDAASNQKMQLKTMSNGFPKLNQVNNFKGKTMNGNQLNNSIFYDKSFDDGRRGTSNNFMQNRESSRNGGIQRETSRNNTQNTPTLNSFDSEKNHKKDTKSKSPVILNKEAAKLNNSNFKTLKSKGNSIKTSMKLNQSKPLKAKMPDHKKFSNTSKLCKREGDKSEEGNHEENLNMRSLKQQNSIEINPIISRNSIKDKNKNNIYKTYDEKATSKYNPFDRVTEGHSIDKYINDTQHTTKHQSLREKNNYIMNRSFNIPYYKTKTPMHGRGESLSIEKNKIFQTNPDRGDCGGGIVENEYRERRASKGMGSNTINLAATEKVKMKNYQLRIK